MLRVSENSHYTKKGAKPMSSSVTSVTRKMGVEHGSSLTTIYDENQLGGKLNKYFQMNNATEQQKHVMLSIAANLEKLGAKTGIEPCSGPEDQVTLSFASNDGVHLIAVTTDGDIMVSFSGYKFSKGWRRFYSYANMDAEKTTYEFLTSVLA